MGMSLLTPVHAAPQILPLGTGEDMPDQEPPLGAQTLDDPALAPSIPLLVLPPRASPPPPPAACGGRPWRQTLQGLEAPGGLIGAAGADEGQPEGLAAEAALGAQLGSAATRERAEAELPERAAAAGLDAEAVAAALRCASGCTQVC